MRSRLRPLFVSGVTTAVAFGVALAFPQVRRALFGAREVLEFNELDPTLFDAPEEPVVSDFEGEPTEAAPPWDPLGRYPLDEKTVRELLPLRGNMQVYDPFCYLRHRPFLDRRVKWAEHPEGSFRIATNSLGLRQDHELSEAPADLRVLVVGDSHITGVCNNSETFAARLAAELVIADPEHTVELANGSNGAYSFFHYLGVLERFLDLGWKPDLFVVCVYGGNDFAGLELWHLFHGTRLAPLGAIARAARPKMRGDLAAAFGQVLHQTEYLSRLDGAEVETAARMAREVSAEIARLCEAEDIEFCIAYLPSAVEIPGQVEEKLIERGSALLSIGPEDFERVSRLADRFLTELDEEGINAVDLRPGFRASSRLLYWRSDLHLNVRGQALAAELVAAALR